MRQHTQRTAVAHLRRRARCDLLRRAAGGGRNVRSEQGSLVDSDSGGGALSLTSESPAARRSAAVIFASASIWWGRPLRGMPGIAYAAGRARSSASFIISLSLSARWRSLVPELSAVRALPV
jgi:hypothetical protein